MADLLPNRTAFLTYPWLLTTAVSAVFILLIYFGIALFYPPPAIIFLAVLIILSSIVFVLRSARLRKERYTIEKDRVLIRRGGLFSDESIEIVVINITNIRLTLPAIEHRLFSTGHVHIMSAGSGGASLHCVERPEEIYAQIITLMQRNGFALKQNKVLQQEQPSTLGIALDFLGEGIGLFIFALWLLPMIIAAFAAAPGWAVGGFVAVGIIVASGIIALSVMRFLDMKRRVYTVYNDTVRYEEGFLTKHSALIPLENVSDAETTQGLLGQVFGLYDVTISCQGSGQEITFSNMTHGKDFAQTLDKIVGNNAERKQVTKSAQKIERKASSKYTASFKPSMKRLFMPWLLMLTIPIILFLLAIVWTPFLIGGVAALMIIILPLIFSIIYAAIVSSCTTYDVKESSVVERFEFLTRTVTEFSTDKITGVVVRESIFDRWLGTFSIEFWSIGSSKSVTFNAIPKQEGIMPAIFQKLGVKQEKLIYEERPHFTFIRMVGAHLWASLAVAGIIIASLIISTAFPILLALPALLGIALVIIVVARRRYYARSRLSCFESYSTFACGWLFHAEYFTFHDDVKSLKSTRYLFGGKTLRFNVAGEHLVNTGKQQYTIPNGFSCHYLEQGQSAEDVIDPRPKRVNQLLLSKPSVANSLIFLLPFCLIATAIAYAIYPIAAAIIGVISVVLIIAVIIAVKAVSYIIDDGRAIVRSGIIYRSEEFVPFSRIDALSASQGMVNKMCGNGNVLIFTAGSAGVVPDMNLKNMREYNQAHALLKKKY